MQCLKAEAANTKPTPVSVVLERVGAELGNLADQVDALQDTLGPLLVVAANEQAHAIVEIQALDGIAQTLSGLSTFIAGLARSGLPPQPVPVESLADRLTLSDLADRLSGRDVSATEHGFEMF